MRYLAFLPILTTIVFTNLTNGDELTLSSGETLQGSVIESTDAAVRFAHPVLGELTIPRDKVLAVKLAGDAPATPAPEAPAAEAPAEPAPEPVTIPQVNPGLFGTSFLRGWNRQIEVAFNGTEGNTETLDVRAAFTTDYEDTTDRWKFSAVYDRSETDSEVSRNQFAVTLTKDWLIPEKPYFFFASGRHDYDEFKDWEHRTSLFGGIGYEFVKSEKWDLRGRAGIGGSYEWEGDDNFTPEALLGLETEYRFNDKHKVLAYTTFFPGLEKPFEFRNITGAAWQIEIDQDLGLSLKLGVENEYESDAAPGDEKNDFKYFGGILWAF